MPIARAYNFCPDCGAALVGGWLETPPGAGQYWWRIEEWTPRKHWKVVYVYGESTDIWALWGARADPVKEFGGQYFSVPVAGRMGELMPMPNRAKRRDENEAEIVAALRHHGVRVDLLDKPLDLMCRAHGLMYGIEVKNPNGKNRLTPDQERWFAEANEKKDAVFIVRSIDEALDVARDMGR